MDLGDLSGKEMLSLITATLSDDLKTKRLMELMETLEKIKASNAEGAALAAQMQAERATALGAKDAAAETLRRAQEMVERAEAREIQTGAFIDGLNREKEAWEAVRQKVDAEHAEKGKDLSAREAAVGDREAGVTRRELTVADRESEASQTYSRYTALIGRVKAVLEEQEPAPLPTGIAALSPQAHADIAEAVAALPARAQADIPEAVAALSDEKMAAKP